MILSGVCVLFIFGCVVSAFPGEYVAKSYYYLDSEGHQSAIVPVRNKRELLKPLMRFRRGNGASTNSQASATAHSSAGNGGGDGGHTYGSLDYNPAVVFPDFADFAQNFPAAFGGGGKGGAYSFASSHSSSSSGGGGNGGTSPSGAGGLGSGHDVGYKGPILFSRIGEAQGTGVEVSGSAQGQRGAYSSSSSAIDNTGKIKYSVQSGKY